MFHDHERSATTQQDQLSGFKCAAKADLSHFCMTFHISWTETETTQQLQREQLLIICVFADFMQSGLYNVSMDASQFSSAGSYLTGGEDKLIADKIAVVFEHFRLVHLQLVCNLTQPQQVVVYCHPCDSLKKAYTFALVYCMFL